MGWRLVSRVGGGGGGGVKEGKIVSSINCREKEKTLETTRKRISGIKPAAGSVSLPGLFLALCASTRRECM